MDKGRLIELQLKSFLLIYQKTAYLKTSNFSAIKSQKFSILKKVCLKGDLIGASLWSLQNGAQKATFSIVIEQKIKEVIRLWNKKWKWQYLPIEKKDQLLSLMKEDSTSFDLQHCNIFEFSFTKEPSTYYHFIKQSSCLPRKND
jgi:hypothetical protein